MEEDATFSSRKAPVRKHIMAIVGITAYLITLYIRPQDWVPFFLNLPINDVIVGGTLLGGLFVSLSSNRKIYLPQHSFIIALLIIIFLSNAVHERIGFGFEIFVVFLKRAGVFLMFILALRSVKQVRYVFFLMVVFSAILVLQGIEQARTGLGWAGQPLHSDKEVRITWIGDWDGPNVLALLFVIAFALSLEFIFGPYSTWVRLMNGSLAIVLLYGVYLTNSRGGMLALSCVLFFYFFVRFRNIYSITAAILIIFLILSFGPSRMGEVNKEESSAREHLWIWEQTLEQLQQNPVMGVGKGYLAKHLETPFLAHNNYVQIASETGLSGFFCWLAIYYFSLKGLYQIQANKSENEAQLCVISLARAMLTAMIGFGVATFFVSMELDILFVLWGLCSAIILLGNGIIPNLEFKISKLDLVAVSGGMVGILGLVYYIVVL